MCVPLIELIEVIERTTFWTRMWPISTESDIVLAAQLMSRHVFIKSLPRAR